MKKLCIICIIICMVSVSVFADLNTGGYAKSYWTPYRLILPEEGDATHTTAVQAPWGEPDISAGMNFDGWSEWGGIHMGIGIANGAENRPAGSYSAKADGWVWVKPFGFTKLLGIDTFTIWLGSPVDEKLMGKIGGSPFANYVLNKSYNPTGEGGAKERAFRLELQDPAYNIFTRMNPYTWGNSNQDTATDGQLQNIWWPRIAAAAMITWEPMKDLYVNFFVAPEMLRLLDWNKDSAGRNNPKLESINGAMVRDDDINQDFYDVKEVYSKLQIGVGYNIPNIGFARAQWVGLRNVLELAFQKSLGDITIDSGVKIPFEGTVKDEDNAFLMSTYKKRRDFQVSVAATYRFYDVRVMGRVDTAFAGSDSTGAEVKQRGLNLIAYLIPSYQLNVGQVGLDLGLEFEQKDDVNGWENDSMFAGIGIWFSREMGNAKFRSAFVTRLPTEYAGSKLPFEIMIPIMLEVGF